jgi:DNA-binding NtrC family response regulator
MNLPRILVIDDVYGRTPRDGRNQDRYDFCYRLKLVDITGDEAGRGEAQKINHPVAEAVFCRGQLEEAGAVRNDVEQVLRVVREGWNSVPVWALVLLDLHFKTGRVGLDGEPEGTHRDRAPNNYFGLELLERIKAEYNDLPVVVLSAMERDPIEAEFSRRGAHAFQEKDKLTHQRLGELVHTYGLIDDDRGLIIGRSKAMLMCLREARRIAATGRANVLLLGETGTGKELLAQYIHDMSPNRDGRFVPVNLHAIPPTLIDNELFGSERGAWTGAERTKVGAAELAEGGTLFLDEFHGIDESVQKKLLRVLELDTRETRRTGPNAETRRIDLQIVMATNDLDIRLSGDYRGDLLRRLPALAEVRLPPLRERRDEIPELAGHLMRRAETKFAHAGRPVWEGRTIEPEGIEVLLQYSWPKNVGDLDAVMTWVVSEYPELRVVSSSQLRQAITILRQREAPATSAAEPRRELGESGPRQTGPSSLEELLVQLDRYEFKPEFEAVAKKLPVIQADFGRFLVRYVRAALLSQREPVTGRINLTGAVKCMTGRELTTAQAADIVRRLLTAFPEAESEVQRDEVLREMLNYVVDLRRGNRNRQGGKPGSELAT